MRARRVACDATVLAASFLAGSVPFSQLAAKHFAGEDLRRFGTGTVSGTALYEVAGFGPLALAGVLEVAKGATGAYLARRVRGGRRGAAAGRGAVGHLGALAAGAAIAGHDWSPWLGWAGGRGLSPALGALLALAPEGAVVLAGGMAAGRAARHSGIVTLVAATSLPLVLGLRRGAPGALLGVCVCTPMVAKRVLGNRPLRDVHPPQGAPTPSPVARALVRLALDRDPAGTVVARSAGR